MEGRSYLRKRLDDLKTLLRMLETNRRRRGYGTRRRSQSRLPRLTVASGGGRKAIRARTVGPWRRASRSTLGPVRGRIPPCMSQQPRAIHSQLADQRTSSQCTRSAKSSRKRKRRGRRSSTRAKCKRRKKRRYKPNGRNGDGIDSSTNQRSMKKAKNGMAKHLASTSSSISSVIGTI